MSEGRERRGVFARCRSWVLEMPRYHKRVVLVLTDFLILSIVLWGAMSLRYGSLYGPDGWGVLLLLLAAPAITLATFAHLGLYRIVTRYFGYRGHSKIAMGMALSVLIWALVVFMSGQLGVPRTVIITYGLVATLAIIATRQAAGLLLKSAGIRLPRMGVDKERRPVVIYGAGHMGVELLNVLRRGSEREAVGFLDSEPSLWGQYVGGLKVYRPEKIARLIEREDVKEVLLALPDGNRRERRRIVKQLEAFPVEVKILPGIEDITSGRVGVSDLRPVDVGDLLGRDAVPPNIELLERSITGKSILVTGAGGSIGGELARQIVKHAPARLVLLDVSEAALYEIDMEIREAVAALPAEVVRPELHAVLGSVLDELLVRETIARFGVQTIYHAAAYKHVPLVESNAVVGLYNNVFGAKVMADAARALAVERFVLISTDKAVRPTNIMGASKRLSELVLQAAASEGGATVFTMVRFGNVLDSSGSVVKRFRQQIKAGGPVTVTHPDVIRYFMSIPEAAELVIQAGAMASGGEVFVLDMGEPVKIDDLAHLMVRLAGLEVRGEDNPDGDIAIVYTGLRPGEKLYEELLIGANTIGTEHPRILRSHEPFLAPDDLARELEALRVAIRDREVDRVRAALVRNVEGYALGELPAPAASAVTEAESWSPAMRTLH